MISKNSLAFKINTKIQKKHVIQHVFDRIFLLMISTIYNLDAEAGGFEPPVQLPVRQFSKLMVSATHPHFHMHLAEIGCKYTCLFLDFQRKKVFSGLILILL